METSPKPVSTFSIALPLGLAYGVFNGLSFIIYESKIPLDAAKNGSGNLATLLAWAVVVGLTIYAHMQYKKKGDGFMGYGQGLVMTIWMGLLGGVVSAVMVFVYLKFMNPEYLESVKDFAMSEASNNSSSDQETEMAEKIMGFMFSPGSMSFIKFLGPCFMFLIVGLIVSIFTKKESAAAPF